MDTEAVKMSDTERLTLVQARRNLISADCYLVAATASLNETARTEWRDQADDLLHACMQLVSEITVDLGYLAK